MVEHLFLLEEKFWIDIIFEPNYWEVWCKKKVDQRFYSKMYFCSLLAKRFSEFPTKNIISYVFWYTVSSGLIVLKMCSDIDDISDTKKGKFHRKWCCNIHRYNERVYCPRCTKIELEWHDGMQSWNTSWIRNPRCCGYHAH